MTDTQDEIKKKINKYAFSGGRENIQLHRELGGDPDVNIAYQWLRYFMDDDNELELIKEKYCKGELLSGELKKITIELVQSVIKSHQERVKAVTNNIIAEFYDYDKKLIN